MTLTTQFVTMLTMISMGGWLGISVDTYCRLVPRTKGWRLILFFNDLLFWCLQGMLVFYVLYKVNAGELRFYIFLAILCGFAAYQALFQNIYKKILNTAIQMILAMYRFFVRIFYLLIIRPIQILIHACIVIILFFVGLLKKCLQTLWKLVHFLMKIILFPLKKLLNLLWWLFPQSWKSSIMKLVLIFRKIIQLWSKK